MGCIESGTILNEADCKTLTYNRDKQFSIVQSKDINEEIRDARSHDIETYANNLIYNSNWNSFIETIGYSIKFKIGSVFNSNLPVTLAFIDFDELITIDFILEMLFDTKLREEWDDSIVSYEVLSKLSQSISILRIVKKFPFMPREYIFKVCLNRGVKECSIAMYSVKFHQANDNKRYEKSEILFGFIKILEKKNHTAILILQQIDNKLMLKPELAASEVNQWVLTFKSQLIQFYHRN